MTKTYSPKAAELHADWHVLDAAGRPLGRLASEIAQLLRGKHKPTFAPHLLVGDFVIVVNADKVVVTGKKEAQKTYYRHSQYPGGLKAINYALMRQKHPTRVIEHAVKGMLPHNRLGAAMLRRLKVYTGPTHPHEAQVRAGASKAAAPEAQG
ncbi:MAG: 50S ribosomal protein L13 [Chloroflexi bacterium]|nr:50S ribosomal protein L13 [Chloroflexota bacterium]